MRNEADAMAIELDDDGRGVDWSAVAASAARRNLPNATRTDLTEALFSDGVSTRTEVTDTSGRGVGLSAVRAECVRMGCTLTIEELPRGGTRFKVLVPATPDPGLEAAAE